MTFPIKGWIPDRCLSKTVSLTVWCAHIQIPSLAHAQSLQVGHETLSIHTQIEDQAGKWTRNKICLQCLALTKKPRAQTGDPNHSAALIQRTDREDVFARHSNTVHHQVHRENCSNTRTCKRQLVHAAAVQVQSKLLNHVFARCVSKWTSHLIGRVTTLNLAECVSVRTDNCGHSSRRPHLRTTSEDCH